MDLKLINLFHAEYVTNRCIQFSDGGKDCLVIILSSAEVRCMKAFLMFFLTRRVDKLQRRFQHRINKKRKSKQMSSLIN
jgi:hypothetical protein